MDRTLEIIPRRRLPWLAVAALFVAIRLLLLGFVPALFATDSYKYLAGADALWHGGGLPPLFESLPVTGGALHAVPGYVWLIDAVWRLAGQPSFAALGLAHAVVCGVGFFLAGRIAAHCAGETAGLAVFAVLALSPSLAWLERLVMPDALAAPLTLAATASALAASPRPGRALRPALGAALAGLLMGGCVLMRTSSQVFLPIPLLVGLQAGRGRAARLAWAALYGLAVLAPLLPWMLHNRAVHGELRLTASTGRNLYFSALWSNTIDREQRARELRPDVATAVPAQRSLPISDATLRGLLARGLSLPEADAAMRALALRAYAEQDWTTLVRQRGSMLLGLFVTDPELSLGSMSLRRRPNLLPVHRPRALAQKEARFRHVFGPAVVAQLERAGQGSEPAGRFFGAWVRLLALDGAPLLASYLIGLPLLAGLVPRRAIAIWSFGAPPLAYLAALTLVGTPLYRYQAGLHPFMLASVVLGATVAARWLRRGPRRA